MGAICGVDRDAQRTDKQIMNWLKEEKKRDDDIIKLLLLGTGESGKSTIAKQLKILFIQGFTSEERLVQKKIIYDNIVNAIKTLIAGARKLGIEIEDAETAERIAALPDDGFTASVAPAIEALWKDSGIQKAYAERSKFQLFDSAQYYLDDIKRLSAADYVPTDQDILRARNRTTGIIEVDFPIQNNKFRLVDVGGQRSERKKWLHCFQDVTAILFIVAISEYDQVLFEDETTNRMQESLKLFGSICNSKWFVETSIILFLNKKDLFAEKLKKTNITVAFPEYKGGQNYDAALEYIQRSFLEKNENPKKEIYVHPTCATDTKNIEVVFSATRDIILRKLLNKVEEF